MICPFVFFVSILLPKHTLRYPAVQILYKCYKMFYQCFLQMPVNQAIQLPVPLVQALVECFCFSPDAKKYGKFFFYKYARTTLESYLRTMRKYRGFLTFAKVSIYPPSPDMWLYVIEYTPSRVDKEIFTRAKACWTIYSILNSIPMPPLVEEAFRGRARLMIPDVKPKAPESHLTKLQIRLMLKALFEVSCSRMDWVVLFSIIGSYFGTLRSTDCLRLLKTSVTWTEQGGIIHANTRKNDIKGRKQHRGFIPFTLPGSKDLNVGRLFQLAWSNLVTMAPKHSRYLFQQMDGSFISPSMVSRHAKKLLTSLQLPYVSAKALRSTMMTNFFEDYDMDVCELLGNWARGGAASFYLKVNNEARFNAARNSL